MHIQPEQTKRLTYWEFTALRHEWEQRNKGPDDQEPVEVPTVEFVRERQAELYQLGLAGKAVH